MAPPRGGAGRCQDTHGWSDDAPKGHVYLVQTGHIDATLDTDIILYIKGTHHHSAHMRGGGRCPVHLAGGAQHAGHVETAGVGGSQHHED